MSAILTPEIIRTDSEPFSERLDTAKYPDWSAVEVKGLKPSVLIALNPDEMGEVGDTFRQLGFQIKPRDFTLGERLAGIIFKPFRQQP